MCDVDDNHLSLLVEYRKEFSYGISLKELIESHRSQRETINGFTRDILAIRKKAYDDAYNHIEEYARKNCWFSAEKLKQMTLKELVYILSDS